MSIQKKTLLSSVLVIVLCLSLIAGSTFALFTSESSVNVAITSGKVKVLATIDETSISLASLNDQTLAETQWVLNGDTLTLTNMVPGDKLSFTIKVENQSNVTVKYRTLVGTTGDAELLSGLIITVNETPYVGATASDWETLIPGSNITDVHVTIELPATAGNEYQEKTLSFKFAVEAVQGNATVESSTPIYTAAELRTALEDGGSYILMNDIDMTDVQWDALTVDHEVVLNGNNHTISNLYVRHYNSQDGVQYGFGFITNANANVTIRNLTFTGADVGPEQEQIDAGKGNIGGVIMGYSHSTTVLENVTVKDSKVSGYGKLGCLIGYADRGSVTLTNCTSKDNIIHGGTNMGGLIGTLSSNTTITTTDCTVENITVTESRVQTMYTLTEEVEVITADPETYDNFTQKAGTYNLNGIYYYSFYAAYYNVITDNYGSTTINGTTYNFCDEWAVNG